MLLSSIEILKHLIHTRLVGVPQSHQAHEWLQGVVHHMALVEEKGIIDECLEPTMKIFLKP